MKKKELTIIEKKRTPKTKEERIPACAYARVSTDNYDQKNSLETQKDYWEKKLGNSAEYELKKNLF